jgi:hypothetical protein
MLYRAIITQVDLHPRIDNMPADLVLRVNIPALNHTFMLETETASLAVLSAKFGLKIISDREWDVTAINNRECEVTQIASAPILRFKFARYIRN